MRSNAPANFGKNSKMVPKKALSGADTVVKFRTFRAATNATNMMIQNATEPSNFSISKLLLEVPVTTDARRLSRSVCCSNFRTTPDTNQATNAPKNKTAAAPASCNTTSPRLEIFSPSVTPKGRFRQRLFIKIRSTQSSGNSFKAQKQAMSIATQDLSCTSHF